MTKSTSPDACTIIVALFIMIVVIGALGIMEAIDNEVSRFENHKPKLESVMIGCTFDYDRIRDGRHEFVYECDGGTRFVKEFKLQ